MNPTGPAASRMALVQASIESGFGPSHLQDPFDWTPDQVVHCLCSPDSTILGSNDRLLLPDPAGFASALREEEIGGEALLTLVTKDMLHDAWGLKYGVCAKILNLIRRLQQQSFKYQEMRKEIVANDQGLLESVAQTSQCSTSYVRSPELREMNVQNLSSSLDYDYIRARTLLEQGPVCQLPSLGTVDTHQIIEVSSKTPPELIREAEFSLALPTDRVQKETTFMDSKGQQRRRLVLAPATVTHAPNEAGPTAPADNNAPRGFTHIEETGFSDLAFEGPGQQLGLSSVGGEILSPVNSNEHINSNAASPQTVSKHVTVEEDQAGQPQRKKIQPILLTEPFNSLFDDQMSTENILPLDSGTTTGRQETDSMLEQHLLGKRGKRKIDQIYYGPSAFHIDDIFYKDIALGATLQDDAQNLTVEQQELSFNSFGRRSNAHRTWINSKMKYFFRSTTSDLIVRDAGQEVGIIPYPDHLGKRNRPLSMTLLSRRADGILAQRANRSDWTTIASPIRTAVNTSASDAFKVRDPLMAVDDNHDDWDSLWKWNHRDDDEMLPLYGDSGSEGEYDLETWREMEAERGKIIRPEGRSKSQKLSIDEVEGVLSIAIKQLRDEWHIKQHPKIRHKARRYWANANNKRTTTLQIKTLEQRFKELDTRILGLRKEICEEEWTKFEQIHRQSKSMQPSVFEREECQWRIAILQSSQAPEKLPAPSRKARKVKIDIPPLQDGEEDLNSNTSSAADEGTEDGLGDFIVDDEVDGDDNHITTGDEDSTMADVEDAVESDTLVISSSDLLPPEIGGKPSPETLPKWEKQPEPGATASNFIDLTQASSRSSSPIPKPEPARIVTPPIFNSEEDSEAWFQRSRSKKPVFKHPPGMSAASFVDLDTDSDCQVLVHPPTELPPFKDIERIRRLSPTKLVEKQDRKRLLVWLIAHTHDDKCERIACYLENLDMEGCLIQLKAGLKKMKAGKQFLRGKDQETSDCILQVAAWYVGWTIPVKLDPQGVSISHIRTTLENDEGFELFYDFMLECLRSYKQLLSTPTKRKLGKPSTQRVDFEPSDSSLSSANPRVFAAESQETRQKRDIALQRMREDNQRAQLRAQKKARRMELLPRFSAMSTLQAEQLEESEVILNPGKLDEQDYIRLNPGFGRGAQLKPHQKEGLQFMWREITGDHRELQGCLLAQTMGLGKTVQVIALLVALSDAANSTRRTIRNQVPIKLHTSQTLILCPPGLIENWWDEFLLWPPEPNYLGEVRKVSAVMKLEERIDEILVWSREGGILLMGYSTFRDLIQNKPRISKANKATATIGSAPLTDDRYRMIRSALLEKPNIVVADEAHEFKSQSSSINQVINQVSCESRIALTGSPLSNNLGEYFSMIDWIAPGYLGSYPDFKNVYETPIQDGLYRDQEPALYRESRKRLKALELELEPKIHRADPSALHNSLSGKSEFVVRVPLTAVQERLYRDFVSITSGVTGDFDGKAREAKLWSCLSMLQLLCNHPESFHNKLLEEQKELKNETKPGLLSENVVIEKLQRHQDDTENDTNSDSVSKDGSNTDTFPTSSVNPDDPEPLLKTVLSLALRQMRMAIDESGEAIDSVHNSNKMQILIRMIELSEGTGDKVLVFSHRLDTLDYVGRQLKKRERTFSRIDGMTPTQRRQEITKSFNEGSDAICLISTKAGGQGLNMFGANRVIILDSHFNPMWEQQAVGRAYRIGQKKHVYVYRLTVAGTFEEEMQDQALFKEQLATRVLEKKNPNRIGLKGAKQYIFPPKQVENGDIEKFLGKDTQVLDHLLKDQEKTPIVSMTPSETFYLDDGNDLTAQERKEAEQLLKDEQLRRRNPAQYQAMLQQRLRFPVHSVASLSQPVRQPSTYSAPSSCNPPSATAPAQSINAHIHDVEARLVSSIKVLFPSGPNDITPRERAPKTLRLEAKSNILDLVLQKHSPHPKNTAGQLKILIDENAKDENDYLRLWRGIRQLLEMSDVDPDILLRVMVDKLGEPRQRRSKGTEKTAHFAQSEDISPESSRSVIKMKPGNTAALESACTNSVQTGNAKRAQVEARSDRPSKKQKPASMDSPNFASTRAKEKKFDRLVESERQTQ